MDPINKKYEKTFGSLPEKVLQIGEGNFLRAFADWIVESANRHGVFNGSVVMAQPIEQGLCDVINSQNGMYTVLMRGVEGGKVVESFERVTSVSRCINPYKNYNELVEAACLDTLEVIISNTTEAGIAYREGDKPSDTPPISFPAKMTALLYARYKKFSGDPAKGLLILPVELIERNGDNLRLIVLKYAKEWQLEPDFISWLENACCFANTLVDRIVTGYPREEYFELSAVMGYEDKLLDTCEPFLFWVIECDKKWAEKFPVDKIGMNIIFTADMTPYRTRKVRILNGAHTVSVLLAYHCGHDIVLEMMNDKLFRQFIERAMFSEIIPTINLPAKELEFFANAVLERFENPFIKHRLLDISLNSVSKYKARCLGSLLDYYRINNKLPPVLTFGLAALINFYKGEFEDGNYIGMRGEEQYDIKDDRAVCEFMHKAWQTDDPADVVLGNTALWGQDLNLIPGLTAAVRKDLHDIRYKGAKQALKDFPL